MWHVACGMWHGCYFALRLARSRPGPSHPHQTACLITLLYMQCVEISSPPPNPIPDLLGVQRRQVQEHASLNYGKGHMYRAFPGRVHPALTLSRYLCGPFRPDISYPSPNWSVVVSTQSGPNRVPLWSCLPSLTRIGYLHGSVYPVILQRGRALQFLLRRLGVLHPSIGVEGK